MDDWTMNNMQKYSFGKMNSYKCELNFMILQTNLVNIYTTFIGIVNQVDYIDNQFHYMLWTTSWFGTHIHNFIKSISWIV